MVVDQGYLGSLEQIISPSLISMVLLLCINADLPFHWRDIWEPHCTDIVVVMLPGGEVVGQDSSSRTIRSFEDVIWNAQVIKDQGRIEAGNPCSNDANFSTSRQILRGSF